MSLSKNWLKERVKLWFSCNYVMAVVYRNTNLLSTKNTVSFIQFADSKISHAIDVFLDSC